MLLRIAEIVFSISSGRPTETLRLGDAYRDFLCVSEEPNVNIYAYYTDLPVMPYREGNKTFDSGMVWSLYRVDGRVAFVLRSPALGFLPYRVAFFDTDFWRGEVYSRIPESEQSPDALLLNPLEFPLSEVLMVCLLAQGRGLMIHACGIIDGERGYLFAGNSTHGKTTMARLWKDQARVLNDDRIVLREREGHFWMYGTPWHGDYTGVSPQGVPVEKIFFLQHAQTNVTRQCEGATAVSMLLARCFPPLWDVQGMSFTLDFCTQLVETVPCYELGFVPGQSILDFVRCVE